MGAFGLEGSDGGTIRPFIKYNAKAGRFFRVDRKQDRSGTWYADDVDITADFEVVMDFSRLEAGYAYYSPNGPQRIMKPYPYEGAPPVRPLDQDEQGRPLYKAGFTIPVYLKSGEEREFGSNASSVVSAVAALYEEYEKSRPNDASLPIVELVEIRADKGAHGNFRPTFAISGWVDQEAIDQWAEGDGVAETPVATAAAATSTRPPSTGSARRPPPVPGF